MKVKYTTPSLSLGGAQCLPATVQDRPRFPHGRHEGRAHPLLELVCLFGMYGGEIDVSPVVYVAHVASHLARRQSMDSACSTNGSGGGNLVQRGERMRCRAGHLESIRVDGVRRWIAASSFAHRNVPVGQRIRRAQPVQRLWPEDRSRSGLVPPRMRGELGVPPMGAHRHGARAPRECGGIQSERSTRIEDLARGVPACAARGLDDARGDMSDFENFWDEFNARFSRAPVWLPGLSIALGDIGSIDKRGFSRLAGLSDFGINFETLESTDIQPDYSVTSEHAHVTDLNVEAGADLPGTQAPAEAKLQVSFGKANAFVVRAGRVQGSRIHNVLAVEAQIKARQATNPFWEKNWIYVQEVVTAQPCIFIVSATAGATSTITATANGGIGSFAQLLNAGAGLNFSSQSTSTQEVVSAARAPFLWRGRWLRGAIREKWVSRGSADSAEQEAVAALYQDFDEPSLFESEPGSDPD
jgi:hypothetical protein